MENDPGLPKAIRKSMKKKLWSCSNPPDCLFLRFLSVASTVRLSPFLGSLKEARPKKNPTESKHLRRPCPCALQSKNSTPMGGISRWISRVMGFYAKNIIILVVNDAGGLMKIGMVARRLYTISKKLVPTMSQYLTCLVISCLSQVSKKHQEPSQPHPLKCTHR